MLPPDDRQGFGDLFKHTKSITYQVLRPFTPIAIDSYTFTPIPLLHSKPTFGYFIQTPSENIAYLTDCAGLPQESLEFLQQKSIDICYIDAGAFVDSNGKKDSSNHLSHYEAAEIIKALAPKQARLIHISHTILESLRDIPLPFPYVL
ncbi:MBL fold metallo-hydrolase [Helicobacter canis]|uniref:Carbon-phosphorus lyase complex accessory protein n=1 Tax=Helicobacter canis TaxID=29419 RepID=A0A377JLH5_9HELI|nr:MBL fold metallo-hydrolase [Helicobacter canis]STP06571.1 carbon-phosphorus lyase complex accessory protein [Helicobacter canis]